MSGGFEVEPDVLHDVAERFRSQAGELAGSQDVVSGSPDAGPSTPFVASVLDLFARGVEELRTSLRRTGDSLDSCAETYQETDVAVARDLGNLFGGEES